MRKLLYLTITLALCSTHGQAQTESEAMTKKLQSWAAAKFPNVPAESRQFSYDMVDLNDDGKNETLVYFIGPEWCGSGGCTMYVLNAAMGVNTIMSVTGTPVYVGAPGGKEVSKGYQHIYVYSKGKGYVKMVWNGKKYPTNPSMAPKIADSVVEGKYKFLDDNKTRYKF